VILQIIGTTHVNRVTARFTALSAPPAIHRFTTKNMSVIVLAGAALDLISS